MGMAVTRKTGPAVTRNRIKRVIREFFRLNQHEICGGLDIAVVPKRSLDPGRVNLKSVSQELLPLLRTICENSTPKAGSEAS